VNAQIKVAIRWAHFIGRDKIFQPIGNKKSRKSIAYFCSASIRHFPYMFVELTRLYLPTENVQNPQRSSPIITLSVQTTFSQTQIDATVN
jgi:hypothetical protein